MLLRHSTLPSRSRGRALRVLGWTVILLWAIAEVTAAAPPKIQFAFLLFPDDVKVSTERDLTLCLVNVGEENSLFLSEGDNLTLSIPAGSGDAELADEVGFQNLACSPPADWSCNVDLSDPEQAQAVLEPDPEVSVGSLQTFCFELTGTVVNDAEGLVFAEMDQDIAPNRAFMPADPILTIFKSLEGTIEHDDLAKVLPDQHHPQTWEVVNTDDIHTIYPGDVIVGPLSGTSAKLTVNGTAGGDSLRVRAGGTTALFVGKDGQVGVGNSAPQAQLEVHSGSGEDPLEVRLFGETEPHLEMKADGRLILGQSGGLHDGRLTVNGAASEPALRVRVDGITKLFVAASGNVGVGTASPSSPLEVDGKLETGTLQVNGGADFAEWFEVIGEIRPGMAVSIDPDHENRLAVSSRAYDRRVAGIVSGAGDLDPGVTLAAPLADSESFHPVALSGRVYCLVGNDSAAISPGDPITTSEVPGHCMKAKRPKKARGAVLGKALGGVEDGLVLVLVNTH